MIIIKMSLRGKGQRKLKLYPVIINHIIKFSQHPTLSITLTNDRD